MVDKKDFHQKYGNILSIEWSKSGKEIVCGTQKGTLFVLTVPELKILHKIEKHHLPVTIVKFSPTMRFLACGDTEGNISIYNCDSYNLYCDVKSHRKQKISFDWHPWNGIDLAICKFFGFPI